MLQILIQKKKNILEPALILMNKTRKMQQQLETDSSGEKEKLYRKPILEHFLAVLSSKNLYRNMLAVIRR